MKQICFDLQSHVLIGNPSKAASTWNIYTADWPVQWRNVQIKITCRVTMFYSQRWASFAVGVSHDQPISEKKIPHWQSTWSLTVTGGEKSGLDSKISLVNDSSTCEQLRALGVYDSVTKFEETAQWNTVEIDVKCCCASQWTICERGTDFLTCNCCCNIQKVEMWKAEQLHMKWILIFSWCWVNHTVTQWDC